MMMKALNPTAENLPRSGIRRIYDEANRQSDVIHLEIGQPDFPTPAHIIAAAGQAARDGFTGYTPNPGYMSLREAFAARLYADHHLQVSPERVIVSAGAMGALFNAFCGLVAPGDEVLIPDPCFPNYYMPIQILGATAVPYPLDPARRFALDVDAIQALITSRTKLILLNSPSNPTGAMTGVEDIQRIVELTVQHGIYIVSDEAYDHIVFEEQHVSPLTYAPPNQVIGIYSCSKTYSMTGWRIGFMVTPPEMAPLMTKLQEMYVSCASSVSQKAAEAALNGPQDCIPFMVNAYRQRCRLAVDLCRELGLQCVVPQGAFYLMIALPEAQRHDSLGYALRLVREGGVALAPGISFGGRGEGFLRASLCTSEPTIAEGLRRLAAFSQN